MSLQDHIGLYVNDPDNAESYSSLISYSLNSLQDTADKEVVKALADAARSETGRRVITDSAVVGALSRLSWQCDASQLLIQICRLGGNLCFDSPDGRACVLETGVLEKLVSVLSGNSTNQEDSIWRVIPSFLHNYCHENKTGLASAEKLLLLVAGYFSSAQPLDEDLVENYINCISGLQQHEGRDNMFTSIQMVQSINYLLEKCQNESTIILLLDLLQELFDKEIICKIYVVENAKWSINRVNCFN